MNSLSFLSINLAIGLSGLVAAKSSILFGPFKNEVETPSLSTSSLL
jgi:hypothetical protein